MPRPCRFAVSLTLSLVWLAAGAALAKDSGDKDKDSEKCKQTKKVTLVRMAVKQNYPEGVGSGSLFEEMQPRLREIIGRLDKASKDENVSGVVLELRDPSIGLGKVEELRAAIARLRKAGKKTYADVQSASTKDYLIASACDEIIMPPSGELMVTGVAAEIMFFKGLLDKLGVKADFIQIGDFKGASEPLTRTEMSPEFRKQFEAVLDDYYEQMVDTVAKDRKLDASKVKELIDVGLFTAGQAKEAGLIDRVCYEDELKDQLVKELRADELVFEKDYGKKKLDTDFSGFGGLIKFFELVMGGESEKKKTKNPKVAVVYAVGEIISGENSPGLFEIEAVGSDTMVKALREAQKDSQVKAIVLRVDSPGGSALASDLIWREIVSSKKPVVASMGDTAASGGYYISMGAKKIFAEPGTLTGSIGVVGGKLAIKGLLSKLGINTETIRRGKHSSTLSMTDPFTPGERDAWRRLMKETYLQFTKKAADGRRMDVEKLEKLAQGRLFTGRMAVDNGLADKLGTLDDAIAEAKSLAGLKADEKVDLLILPEPKSFFEQLFGGNDIEARVGARFSPGLLGPPARAIESARRMLAEPVSAVLPFRVEFR